ncbi:hypothetical protein [Flavobacterium pedocola]
MDVIRNEEKLPVTALTYGSTQRGVVFPANPANAYDNAGRLHNELFEAYYSNSQLPTTTDSIVDLAESIGTANNEFNALKGIGYVPVSASRVDYIVSHQSVSMAEIMDASPLSSTAKLSLIDFISDLTTLYATEDNYETIYTFIVAYEAGIIQNSQLTQTDRRIMLTTSSIARYSTYMGRKKPKQNTDADWTIFVGNIVSGTEGACIGTAEAIIKAFVTGVAENSYN